jgi:hypothetical protein
MNDESVYEAPPSVLGFPGSLVQKISFDLVTDSADAYL